MSEHKYRLIDTKTEKEYFRFLMASGVFITFSFAVYYYYLEIMELAYVATATGFFFGLLYMLFSQGVPLILLFRLGILATYIAFYLQVLYTGAIHSPSLTIFVTFPLFGFFYRPKIDRFVFAVASALSVVSMWFWNYSGYSINLIPPDFRHINSLVVSLFLLTIVTIFAGMFWVSIRQKNRKLVSSLKKLESATDKLVQSEKMASLGILSAGIAHEINNPLNFIKGGIYQVKELIKAPGISLSKETQNSIEMMDEGVQRVKTIINSLNHFSRTNQTNTTWCNVHQLLDNCQVMLQHRIDEQVTMVRNYGDNIPALRANEGKLHQVFLNILTNALQAIEAEGQITISTSCSKGWLHITIQDTGSGIPPEYLNKVIDPFFTTKNPGEGTGLGLYICYNLIKEHNGQLTIDSEVGKGTVITTSFEVEG